MTSREDTANSHNQRKVVEPAEFRVVLEETGSLSGRDRG